MSGRGAVVGQGIVAVVLADDAEVAFGFCGGDSDARGVFLDELGDFFQARAAAGAGSGARGDGFDAVRAFTDGFDDLVVGHASTAANEHREVEYSFQHR
jgi:hypothetical protein